MSNLSLTQTLAELLVRPVDEDTRRLASLHLLDWLASSFAATTTDEGRALASYVATRPSGRSSALTVGNREPWSAALLNGGLSIALESDATHREARLHPGTVTIAAALSSAEHRSSTGTELLDAIVRGYEAMIRLGEAVGPRHYEHWHTTSTCGPFGSAAAAISLTGSSEPPTRDLYTAALGNAGSLLSGLWQTREERTPTKLLHAGHAAMTGMMASDLALAGMAGPREILEGVHGFFVAACPDPDRSAIGRPGTTPWKISTTSLKPWPGCRHVHPAISAALALRDRLGSFDPSTVEKIELNTYRDALVFADRPQPGSRAEAMFSLQHAVATALVAGAPRLENFDPLYAARADIAALRAKVAVAHTDIFDQRYPRAWGASLEVFFCDGRREVVVKEHALGDPEDPLETRHVEAKALGLFSAARIAVNHADDLVDCVLNISASPSLNRLSELIRTAGTKHH
jgi:2-methylcitrate dehydratase PrpD